MLRRLTLFLKATTVTSLLVVVSFFLILSHDFLTQCDYFKTETLTVQGSQRLSTQDVLQQAQLTAGINALSVNLPLTRKRLLGHPWIAEASINRELPGHLNIRVVEHKPLAILDLGRKFLMNEHGAIFKEKVASDPQDLPVVTGLEFSDIIIADRPGSDAFKAVMEVLKLGQRPACVLSNRLIKRIEVDKEIGLTLFAFEKDKVIKLGYHNYRNKYAMLKTVLFHLKKEPGVPDFEVIDLNHSNRIVVTPVKNETPSGQNKEVQCAETGRNYCRS
ncbi:cell division protein FtsQ/DivIB [Thermodesulfobacteriota bacterium]